MSVTNQARPSQCLVQHREMFAVAGARDACRDANLAIVGVDGPLPAVIGIAFDIGLSRKNCTRFCRNKAFW
jgi:hypothetical protein